MLYPLKMRPYFRHGSETPWGGKLLKELYGLDIPDERTGESLSISALGGMASTVENGPYAGKPFPEVLKEWGYPEPFPLLVKLLDARELLSVQVHPGDDYAKEHDNKLGKTEAWVVLNAPAGAKLVYGVDTQGGDLRQMVADGRLESALHWIPVSKGDVLYIPHGLVHALGNGIVVYEIQQSSDATYRFWDWGRVDARGQARALHTEKALDVTRPDLRPQPAKGARLESAGGTRTVYICDENFALWRLEVEGEMPLDTEEMLLLTAFGDCRLDWAGGSLALKVADSVFIPKGLSGVKLVGNCQALCAATPNQAALRAALGPRSADVAGL